MTLKTTTLFDWFQTPSIDTPSALLMDGGVSTHLQQLMNPQKFSHRELWSSSLLLTKEGQQYILQGHNDWLRSGSDIITTVTYQCHYGVIQQKNIVSDDQMTQMIHDGIDLAKQVTKTNTTKTTLGPYVVASTGPYGAAMADGSEYTGNYPTSVTRQVLIDFHTRKLQTLLDCNPDGLAIETVPNLEEVDVICHLLCDIQQKRQQQNNQNKIACWISFACRNGTELNDGHTLEDALTIVHQYDPNRDWIVAVGINCCDSAYVSSLVEILAKNNSSQRGIVIYPNSGEDWDAANEDWKCGTGTTDTEFSDRLMDAVKIANEAWKRQQPPPSSSFSSSMPKIVLGGCCRTSKRTIAELRQRIDEWNLNNNK
jgi:homocysteine S-methyltransferase